MANTKSAEKRARQSETKRLQNRSVKSGLRKAEKDFVAAVEATTKDEAAKAFRKISSMLDKAAKTGVLRKETASRTKSRLAAKVNKLK
jgi:small subunit ribosomal protein S20